MSTSTISTTLKDSTYYVTTTQTLTENSYNIEEYFPLILLSSILLLFLCACICGKKNEDIESNNFSNCEMTNYLEATFNESFIDDDGDVIVFDSRTTSSKTLN